MLLVVQFVKIEACPFLHVSLKEFSSHDSGCALRRRLSVREGGLSPLGAVDSRGDCLVTRGPAPSPLAWAHFPLFCPLLNSGEMSAEQQRCRSYWVQALFPLFFYLLSGMILGLG